MPDRYVFTMKHNGKESASIHWGSVMHGLLIENLPEEWQNALHGENTPQPVSQYVLPLGADRLQWIVNVMEPELSAQIAEFTQREKTFFLRQKNVSLELEKTETQNVTEQEWFAKFFLAEQVPRRYILEYITPSTHKTEGSYALFPSAPLIIKNLYKRMSACVHSVSLEDEQALEQLAQSVYIARYQLHSKSFFLEGRRIPAYIGNLTLQIRGNSQIARLAAMTICFSAYSGVGIKTALGMGAARVEALLQHTSAE